MTPEEIEGARILREWSRAQRAIDAGRRQGKKSSSGGGGSGRGLPARAPRTRRAPPSASQFRYEKKYSSRTGGRGARGPTSAVEKVKYDFDLNQRGDDRVAFEYVAFPRGTPPGALDPIAVAREAERTAGRQINCRQMSHDTISLPQPLSSEGKKRLVIALAEEISRVMGVPVFAVEHEAPDENGNFHAHLSYPIREIIQDRDSPGGFRMGDRIAWEQRAGWREARGLEKTTKNDLIELRNRLAWLCANALAQEHAPRQLVERWKHGAKPLNSGRTTQVAAARARGDAEFVQENQHRETQQHEGPGLRRRGGETPQQAHNAALEGVVAPSVLAERVMRELIRDARVAGVNDWEGFRRAAADRGLNIHYNRQRAGKNRGAVSGLRYEIGGIRIAGKSVGGLSLGGLQRELRARGLEFASERPSYAPAPAPGPQAKSARLAALNGLIGVQNDQSRPAQRASRGAAPGPAGHRPQGGGSKQQEGNEMKNVGNASIRDNERITQQDRAFPPLNWVEKAWARAHALKKFRCLEEPFQRVEKIRRQAYESVEAVRAAEPKKQIGLIFKRVNPQHAVWKKEFSEARKNAARAEKKIDAWLRVNVYDNRDVRAALDAHRREEAERLRLIVIRSYEQAKKVWTERRGRGGGEGFDHVGSHAEQTLRGLERDYPGWIADYESGREAREAAEREQQRQAPQQTPQGQQRGVVRSRPRG